MGPQDLLIAYPVKPSNLSSGLVPKHGTALLCLLCIRGRADRDLISRRQRRVVDVVERHLGGRGAVARWIASAEQRKVKDTYAALF
jgi:hypothetical protein